MPTRLVLCIQDPETGNSAEHEVEDDFEQVFNKVFPPIVPSSGLEHQQNMRYTKVDGKAFACPPSSIAWIEDVDGKA